MPSVSRLFPTSGSTAALTWKSMHRRNAPRPRSVPSLCDQRVDLSQPSGSREFVLPSKGYDLKFRNNRRSSPYLPTNLIKLIFSLEFTKNQHVQSNLLDRAR